MARARSPGYPVIGLKEAIEKVTAVYQEDYQNKLARQVIARHMGYKTMNGRALGVLSSLGKFGLLEGRGDETGVSDLALQIIAHPVGSPERAVAIIDAADRPDLFAEIDKRFPEGKASDQAIKSYLLTKKFLPDAADTAIRSYRETKKLVAEETSAYTPPNERGNGSKLPFAIGDCVQWESGGVLKLEKPARIVWISDDGTHVRVEGDSMAGIPMDQLIKADPVPPPLPPAGGGSGQQNDRPPLAGERRVVFALAEGDVVMTFPEELSPESVQDLESYLNVFMRKARRESGLPAAPASTEAEKPH